MNLLMYGGFYKVVKHAQELGLSVTVIDKIVPEETKNIVDYLEIDYLHDSDHLELITKLHKEKQFNHVVSYTEKGILFAINVAIHLGLRPFVEPDVVQKIFNKTKMRKALETSNTSQVPFCYVSDINTLKYFVKEQGLPIILKPNIGGASRYVRKIVSLNDNIFKDNNLSFPDCGLIAEKAISGMEFSVENFSYDGKHACVRIHQTQLNITSIGNPFVEMGHFFPPYINTKQHERIIQATFECLDSIGFKNGPSHTEVILDKQDNVYIIETHARIGGDRISTLIEYSSGFQYYKEALGWECLRNKMTAKSTFSPVTKAIGIHFFIRPPGKIKSIHGIDEIKEIEGLKEINIFVKQGDIINECMSSADRIGNIIIEADSNDELLKICDEVDKNILKIKYVR